MLRIQGVYHCTKPRHHHEPLALHNALTVENMTLGNPGAIFHKTIHTHVPEHLHSQNTMQNSQNSQNTIPAHPVRVPHSVPVTLSIPVKHPIIATHPIQPRSRRSMYPKDKCILPKVWGHALRGWRRLNVAVPSHWCAPPFSICPPPPTISPCSETPPQRPPLNPPPLNFDLDGLSSMLSGMFSETTPPPLSAL